MPNIRETLAGLGCRLAPPNHHHSRHGWVQMDCPWCNRPGKFHLGINESSGAAACWICGKRRLADVIAEACKIPLPKAIEITRGMGGRRYTRPDGVEHGGTYREPVGVGDMLPAHRDYLASRGFDPDNIATIWGVRGIGIAPRLQWRLFIPIYYGGRVVSYTTRAIGDVEQRYISASEGEEAVSHKTILYGGHMARASGVVVHEGAPDAWAIGPGAVATMGVAITPPQVAAIAAFPVRAICFDGDAAGRARARELVNALAPFPGETYNVRLDAKDAATASEEERREIRKMFLGGA